MSATLRPVAATDADPFEVFWDVCAKKVEKALARAKFTAIVSPQGLVTRIFDRDSNSYVEVTLHATADELIRGMKAYRETQIVPSTRWDKVPKLKDEGRYTLHPATWLNRGRWQDGP